MLRKSMLATVASVVIAWGTPALADPASDAVADQSRSEADRALDEGRNPVEVLRFSGPKEGDVIADFMAGDGYYSALLAEIVGPRGAVYALNPAAFHNPEIWEARTDKHSNIRPIGTRNRAMVLAPDSVHMIFTNQTFHDIYWTSERFQMERIDERAMLANWFAALKPGGHVIVIDHVGQSGDTREVVDAVHRIDPATVLEAMQAAGFVLVGQSDMLRRSDDEITKSIFDESVRGKTDRFMMKFQKPAE